MSSEAAPKIAKTIHYGMFNVQKTLQEATDGLRGTPYRLVDIPNDSVKYTLAGLIDSPSNTAWIYAWQGSTYYPDHPILYTNGNITAVTSGDEKRSYAVQWED
jgi:hypothetical protein